MRTLSAFLGIGVSTLAASCVINLGSESCGSSIVGSGVRATEVRSVGSFSRIRVSGSADVTARVGEAGDVKVSGDDNLLRYVRVRVEDDTLVIDLERGSYSPRCDLEVDISAPRIEGIAIHGSGDADVSGLSCESFAAAIAGSGSVKASGTVDRLTASIAGSGDLELYGVKAKHATVQIAGSGEAEVSASDELSIQISGSGDVSYRGQPKLHQSIAGSGEVRHAD